MAEMDDYGRHEVLHMASFLSRAVAAELGEHAQVQAHPEWKALADQAAEALGALSGGWGGSSGERNPRHKRILMEGDPHPTLQNYSNCPKIRGFPEFLVLH